MFKSNCHNDDMTFAQMLEIAKGDLSQNQLAQKVGMSQSAISKFLNGTRTPTITTVWRLERALPTLRKLQDEQYQRSTSLAQ